MRRSWFRRTLLVGAATVAIAIAAFGAWAWRAAIPLQAESLSAFDATLVATGANLVAIGNCNVCHTRADGPPYAGGRPIATPFGRVYATNITPDKETGIRDWSEAAFVRAMREGVSRDGHHLYPAFPYDHMVKMRDSDIRAVYAFIMTRRPVRAVTPPNELAFPFNLRVLAAAWKLLFLSHNPVAVDTSKTAEWNRGAYLVEGLGHCGACHTPRNILGAEKRGQAYAGGESEGWIAPALNAASPAAVPWTADRLYTYLRHGFDDLHGIAAGPMAPVVNNLANVADADVRAIAIYVADVAGAEARERQINRRPPLAIGSELSTPAGDGAAVYAGACAQCHGEAGRFPPVPALDLSLSAPLRLPRPDNLLRIVREGIHPLGGGAGQIMPGFGNVLTDAQLSALASYLRAHFTDKPPWTDLEAAVHRVKQGTEQTGNAEAAARTP
jgi:mono/diheme cytochrome c family protein